MASPEVKRPTETVKDRRASLCVFQTCSNQPAAAAAATAAGSSEAIHPKVPFPLFARCHWQGAKWRSPLDAYNVRYAAHAPRPSAPPCLGPSHRPPPCPRPLPSDEGCFWGVPNAALGGVSVSHVSHRGGALLQGPCCCRHAHVRRRFPRKQRGRKPGLGRGSI